MYYRQVHSNGNISVEFGHNLDSLVNRHFEYENGNYNV